MPGPDRTISSEDIKNLRMVSKRYRNRRIGDFLKELKLVEGRNTGIPTIVRAMEQNGSNKPIFETDSERTYLTVILPVHSSFLIKRADAVKTRKNMAEVKRNILEIVSKRKEVSASDIAIAMGYPRTNNSVKKAVHELIATGDIAYTNAEKPRSPNQKLRLV